MYYQIREVPQRVRTGRGKMLRLPNKKADIITMLAIAIAANESIVSHSACDFHQDARTHIICILCIERQRYALKEDGERMLGKFRLRLC